MRSRFVDNYAAHTGRPRFIAGSRRRVISPMRAAGAFETLEAPRGTIRAMNFYRATFYNAALVSPGLLPYLPSMSRLPLQYFINFIFANFARRMSFVGAYSSHRLRAPLPSDTPVVSEKCADGQDASFFRDDDADFSR